jgi:threonylcarbamoyladenosine tRNA methylthiotransferase MtaB
VPAGVVVEQVKRLVDKGFAEVVLTGVDLTSWGADLPGAPHLGDLVLQLLRLTDIARLRISSIDSIEADPALMEAIATEPRLMPHLHLSLQAGDDMILKRMKRRHLREDAIGFSKRAKALRPDVVFGADLIAGFPTETDEMFENSKRIVNECDLTYLHVFPYSPRPGTPAARMPQLHGGIIKERARQLRALGESALRQTFSKFVGTTVNVLVEEADQGIIKGKTDHFAPIQLLGNAEVGSIILAKVMQSNAHCLEGQSL